MSKPLFEHTTCARCGGTGEYSFNLMHGSRCYGCNGTGYSLTKRGQAAQKFLDSLRKKRVEEVKICDLILFDLIVKRAFLRVESIQPDELNGSGRTTIKATFKGETWAFGTVPGMLITMGLSAEEKEAHRRLAIEYQATLTKKGLVSKRAKAPC